MNTNPSRRKSPGNDRIDHDKGFPAVSGAVDSASASATPIPATAALARLAWCLTNQQATGTASNPGIPDHSE